MTLDEIEKKYERRIGNTIKRMKNKSMAELWVEFDKLKEQMRKDLSVLD